MKNFYSNSNTSNYIYFNSKEIKFMYKIKEKQNLCKVFLKNSNITSISFHYHANNIRCIVRKKFFFFFKPVKLSKCYQKMTRQNSENAE